jgi:thiol-disulfide isomerase/thioredoxin
MRFPLFFLLFLAACSAPADKAGSQKIKAGDPLVAPEEILVNVRSFMNYKQDYLKLSVHYTAYDTALHAIDKARFLQLFASGEYLPLRIAADTGVSYKLYKLPDSTNKDVTGTIRYYGEVHNNYFKREGTPFPAGNFSDVDGKVYNREMFKGKTVVLKFWFIHCVACVAEMPALNRLVVAYHDHKEVLFLSMAEDTKEQLITFLQKKPFQYATIPVSKEFVSKEMKVSVFPTHMILKNGVITKVADSAEELIDALHETVVLK